MPFSVFPTSPQSTFSGEVAAHCAHVGFKKKIEFLRPNNAETTTCRRGILASRHHTTHTPIYTSLLHRLLLPGKEALDEQQLLLQPFHPLPLSRHLRLRLLVVCHVPAHCPAPGSRGQAPKSTPTTASYAQIAGKAPGGRARSTSKHFSTSVEVHGHGHGHGDEDADGAAPLPSVHPLRNTCVASLGWIYIY
jgi:hypothetical protein